MEEDDFVIQDTENFIENKNQEFSHSVLVMTAISRCSLNLSKEMRSGYWNEKVDKYGNLMRYYIEDTRKVFIGSVKALLYIMGCNYNPIVKRDEEKPGVQTIRENIFALQKELENKKEQYLLMEAKDWETSPKTIRDIRMKQGLVYRQGLFCSKLPYENEYILQEVLIYEKVLEELVQLAKITNVQEAYYN